MPDLGQTHLLAPCTLLERAELFKDANAVVDLARHRCFDERKALNVAQPRLGHEQNDGGEVRAQNLGVGELGPGEEVLLGVQAHRHAWSDTSASTGTLIR